MSTTRPRKAKRPLPNVAVVQITEGGLSITIDLTKLGDGVLEEIIDLARRQLAKRKELP
jgi:hypothetical protein